MHPFTLGSPITAQGTQSYCKTRTVQGKGSGQLLHMTSSTPRTIRVRKQEAHFLEKLLLIQ